MSGCLLDVSALVALFWPLHEDHTKVQSWFRGNSRLGWATCSFTQAAFVRITSNPAFSQHAVEPCEAADLLRANVAHPDHRFWASEMPFLKVIEPFSRRLKGHKQVTDAYLLGLVLHKKGKLVSLDRRIVDLLPDKTAHQDLVVLL